MTFEAVYFHKCNAQRKCILRLPSLKSNFVFLAGNHIYNILIVFISILQLRTFTRPPGQTNRTARTQIRRCDRAQCRSHYPACLPALYNGQEIRFDHSHGQGRETYEPSPTPAGLTIHRRAFNVSVQQCCRTGSQRTTWCLRHNHSHSTRWHSCNTRTIDVTA